MKYKILYSAPISFFVLNKIKTHWQLTELHSSSIGDKFGNEQNIILSSYVEQVRFSDKIYRNDMGNMKVSIISIYFMDDIDKTFLYSNQEYHTIPSLLPNVRLCL